MAAAMEIPEILVTSQLAQEDGGDNSNTSKDVLPETETTSNSTCPQVHEDGGCNVYVDIIPGKQDMVTCSRSSNHYQRTQSQKKRRGLIPFKYHPKIFKTSKKKTNKNGNELSIFKGADPHKHATGHSIEDNRSSTNSSCYESCRPCRNTLNGSCHTYMDIDECHEHRDMDLERCNSISTVSTLPMHVVSAPQTSEERELVGTFGRTQSIRRQEQTPSNIGSDIQYEIKKRKGNRIKKYMVLFCIVLVSVVVSTVLAGYVGSRNVEKDIPNDPKKEFQKMSEREYLEMIYSNLTEIKGALQLDLKSESKTVSELVLQRFMNETDFMSWKKDINKNIYTIIFSLACVRNCTNQEDGDYQSCHTCNGYVSCGGHVLSNRVCPSTLMWDNLKGRCEYSSSTCDPKHLPKLD